MKVLLFTHESDIDGMGNVVFAKMAFDEVDYVLTETYELQGELAKFYDDGSIYDYDMIFVTDLWLEDPMLTKVATDERLAGKFFVFDHHKSAIEGGFNRYPFTTIRYEDELGLCCGTSLFHEFLVSLRYLDSDNKTAKDFAELTRRYDTWEWKTRYDEETPHLLTLLFDAVGPECYIELMYQKLAHEKDGFAFSELEKKLIDNKIRQIQGKFEKYAEKILYKTIFGLKAGIVFIDYEYRNDLTEYFRQHDYDMDFVMLISMDKGTVSYRNIRKDVNVRVIAEALGGKGNDKSAGSPISEAQKQAMVKVLLTKSDMNL